MVLPNLDDALSTAQSVIDLAAEHILLHRPLRISTKGDRDLLTDVDIAVEAQIRDSR
jgi:myo-inositol-1(or 4)-monophosphatase